ncbi:MAG: crossover junction endodeoxyribonuclease RuvC [Candidatus Omnitrophica bacterium]|nr:crossover junction endodeoxyribonuclease RuvC [Candidatus Omnitrophota bacterium]
MIILGIDPGLNHFGFGIIEYKKNKIIPIEYGQQNISRKYRLEDKLKFIEKNISLIIDKYNPDVVAVEKIYVAKNPQIALDIGIVSGIILGISLKKNKDIFLISPLEIKKEITGTGQADKQQVGFMVEKILNLNKEIKEDASDALATALCYITQQKFNKLLEKAY